MACQRARNIGVRRSSSAHNASSQLTTGSSPVATVAAMRNLAGRRFSATSRYQDSAPRTAGSSQIFSLARSLMKSSIYCLDASTSRSARKPHLLQSNLCSASGFLDLDFLLLLRHLRRFGQLDVKYLFANLRRDLRRIGIKGQRDRSAKRAIAAFHHVPVLVLVLFITRGLFLAADSQHPISEGYFEILLFDARQLCCHFNRVFALGNVDLWR